MKTNDVYLPFFLVVSNLIAALVTTKAVTYIHYGWRQQQQQQQPSKVQTSSLLRNLQQDCCACSVEVPIVDLLQASLPLREAVTVPGIMQHLTAFQGFADEFDGNRAEGTEGYAASAAYVVSTLEDAGYQVTVQGEDARRTIHLGASELSVQEPDGTIYTDGGDFFPLDFSPFGTASGPAQLIGRGGCDPASFANFAKGGVALIYGGGACSDTEKVQNAQTAGATGAIMYGILPTLEEGLQIPVFDSYPWIVEALEGKNVFMFSNTSVQPIRQNVNIIAELPRSEGGDDITDEVVMVGAHLDSVAEGPGIQDDGSGSACILEIAVQLAKLGVTTKKRIRFGWWDSEELGLLGSYYYVSTLENTEISKISAYLNFDMIASPNFVRIVYSPLFKGEDALAQVFVDYFASQELPIMPLNSQISRSIRGSTDNEAFQFADIPTTGLFTGARTRKTESWANIFGGTAGIAMDPCYHTSCDRVENINQQSMDEMSDAACHGILTVANTMGQ